MKVIALESASQNINLTGDAIESPLTDGILQNDTIRKHVNLIFDEDNGRSAEGHRSRCVFIVGNYFTRNGPYHSDRLPECKFG